MKTIALTLLIALSSVSCGGDSNCKNACTIVSNCGLKTSGLSCDTDCSQGGCASCVSGASCNDIIVGACASACPGVSFTKK
jgi:hypothetical protein